jgi:hypothetical protein
MVSLVLGSVVLGGSVGFNGHGLRRSRDACFLICMNRVVWVVPVS